MRLSFLILFWVVFTITSCQKSEPFLVEDFFKCTVQEPVNQRIKIFIIAGQSNAGHLGKVNEIPEGYFGDECVWYYYRPSKGFLQMEPGENTCGAKNCDKAGVEVSIGKELVDKYNEPILIYKYFQGGSPLAQKEDYEDWSTRSVGENYDQFKSNFEELKNNCLNCNFDFIGMAWIQGEKDASLSVKTADYKEELSLMMNDIRSSIAPNLSLSIVQLNVAHAASEWNVTKIRNAQNEFVEEDEHSFIIEVDDINYDPNNPPHYKMEGYLEIGKRIAANH